MDLNYNNSRLSIASNPFQTNIILNISRDIFLYILIIFKFYINPNIGGCFWKDLLIFKIQCQYTDICICSKPGWNLAFCAIVISKFCTEMISITTYYHYYKRNVDFSTCCKFYFSSCTWSLIKRNIIIEPSWLFLIFHVDLSWTVFSTGEECECFTVSYFMHHLIFLLPFSSFSSIMHFFRVQTCNKIYSK